MHSNKYRTKGDLVIHKGKSEGRKGRGKGRGKEGRKGRGGRGGEGEKGEEEGKGKEEWGNWEIRNLTNNIWGEGEKEGEGRGGRGKERRGGREEREGRGEREKEGRKGKRRNKKPDNNNIWGELIAPAERMTSGASMTLVLSASSEAEEFSLKYWLFTNWSPVMCLESLINNLETWAFVNIFKFGRARTSGVKNAFALLHLLPLLMVTW